MSYWLLPVSLPPLLLPIELKRLVRQLCAKEIDLVHPPPDELIVRQGKQRADVE